MIRNYIDQFLLDRYRPKSNPSTGVVEAAVHGAAKLLSLNLRNTYSSTWPSRQLCKLSLAALVKHPVLLRCFHICLARTHYRRWTGGQVATAGASKTGPLQLRQLLC